MLRRVEGRTQRQSCPASRQIWFQIWFHPCLQSPYSNWLEVAETIDNWLKTVATVGSRFKF
jgi:hypothetical protein